MKKLLFPLLYTVFCCFSVFGAPSLKTVQLKSSLSQNNYNCGTGIVFSFMDLKGFGTVKDNDFSNVENIRWSIGSCLFKTSIPFKIKAGTLSLSRSASKLNSPFSTSVSPLTRSFSASTGLGITDPSLSSSVKPRGFSAEADFSRYFPLCLQFFADENLRFLVNASSKAKISAHSFFSTSLTYSSSILQNSSSYAVKNNVAFDSGRYNALLAESYFSSPYIKIAFKSAIHQNPYGINVFWLNAKTRITAGSFLGEINYFCIPTSGISPQAAPLIAADSSIIKTTEQTSVLIQTAFFPDKTGTLVRSGISATDSWKLAGTSEPVTINTLKASAAISFESPLSTFKTEAEAVNLLLWGTPPSRSAVPEKYYCLSSSFYRTLCGIRTVFSSSLKQYPPYDDSSAVKQRINLSLSLYPSSFYWFSAGGKAGFYLKNGLKESASASLWCSVKYSKKFFSACFKISYEQDFK